MRTVTAAALLALAGWCGGQAAPRSPCPDVLKYEPPGSEQDRWYGVISVSTDSTIYSLWLNIVLDSKADLLGNWDGDVTSTDNQEFKIENTIKRIYPGPATDIRFFVKYNPLMKIPRVTEIRLNGREICNANIPQPAPYRPDLESNIASTSVESTILENSPESLFGTIESHDTKPVKSRPSGPVYKPTQNPPIAEVTAVVYSINPSTNNWLSFITGSQPMLSNLQPVQPSPRPAQQNSQLVLQDPQPVPSDSKPNTPFVTGPMIVDQGDCGKVTRNPNPLVINGKPTLEGQWPWHVALYQFQQVDNKYICGGTLVSRQHVVTAAHCVTRKHSQRVVNKNTLSVYLGKHNLRTSTEGVQIRFVTEIIVHPQYNATTFARDLGILKLQGPVQVTEFVRPACLWPEELADLSNVVGYIGTVVGWGFDATGVPTEELARVEMPVVGQETCIRSYSSFFGKFTSDTTYCAGYRDGTSVCNGDSGGGMMFNIGGTWYLRGLVSLSVARATDSCDPSHYVIFTDLAKFLFWIKEIIRSSN